MSTGEWISTSMPYLSPPDGRTDTWSAEAAARGGVGRQRILDAGEVAATSEVAWLLDVPLGAPVVVRRRLMYLDDRPVERTDTYYPGSIAAGTALAGKARIRGGAVSLLAELGHTGVRAREDVAAELADPDARAALHLDPGDPVLKVARCTGLSGQADPGGLDDHARAPSTAALRDQDRMTSASAG